MAEVWQRCTRRLFSLLWENPAQRKRWALRWRTEAAARDLAHELGWEIAASLDGLIPLDALSNTLRHAILDEFATSQQLDRDSGPDAVSCTITRLSPARSTGSSATARTAPATPSGRSSAKRSDVSTSRTKQEKTPSAAR